MADSSITKRALASAIQSLMAQMPFEKISISDICEQCGMSRKSFYYHFRDKYDLVNWIFDVEFFQEVSQQESEGVGDFFSHLCNYFYENHDFYRRALKIEGQNSFQEHFRDMMEPVVGSFLRQKLDTTEHLDFCVQFYTDALIGAFVRWLSEKDCSSPEEFINLLNYAFNILKS